MTRLRLGLLGPMQVILNGQPIVTFPYEKVRALFAYLVTEANYPHHRDRLASLLWADQCETKARSNLRKALSTLRQMLGDATAHSPLFLTTRNTIQFNPAGDYILDVAILTQLLDRYLQHSHSTSELCSECVSGLEQAVVLYRGSFLEQIQLPDSETFETWITLHRQRLHDLVLNAYVKLVTHYEHQHHYQKAQQHVQRQLQLEPWNEAAHRCLMQILAQCGRRTEALQQYDRCCKVLEQELATEPDPTTIALWEAIRSDTFPSTISSAASSSTNNNGAAVQQFSSSGLSKSSTVKLGGVNKQLPAPVTSFVGRKQELTKVCELLQRNDVRLLTLTGIGGTGKTRLALEAAAIVCKQFTDGAWFVSLAAVSKTASADAMALEVCEAISQTLGIKLLDSQSWLTQLASVLQDRQLLLLLDNFEHLCKAAALISDLLSSCPGVKVLVTSRVKLNLYGEWNFVVPPLTLPDAQAITHLPTLESEAVQLFVERASSAQADFTLTHDNRTAIVKICRHLDGLPLAIELAAAQTALSNPEALLAQLNHRLTVLVNAPRNPFNRHQTLRAAIAWSYELLLPEHQRLFRRLGVFVGSWTVDAADAVCNHCSSHSLQNHSHPILVRESVFALCRHHLLQQQDSDREPRFTILETIREYALEQLDEHQEMAITQKHHALYYLQFVETTELELQDAPEAIWLHKLTPEYPNIRVALEWALQHQQDEVLARFVGVLYRFWFFRDLQTGRYWLERALDYRHRLSYESLAKVLLGAGCLASRQRDYAQATIWLRESLALYEQLNNTSQLFKLHHELGMVSLCQEAYHQAQIHFEQSLMLARQLDTITAIGMALAFLPAPMLYQGDYAQAKLLLNQALEFSREQNNRYLVAVCLVGLSHVLLATQEYKQVQQHCTEALMLCQEFQYQEGLAWVLETFAGLAAMQQQPVQAVRLYGVAERLRQESGAPVPPHIQKFYAPFIAAAHSQLTEAEFMTAWAEGQTLSPEEAMGNGRSHQISLLKVRVEATA